MAVKAKKELEKIHPYEVPCILSWDTDANAPYLDWAMKETTPKSKKK